MSERERVLAHFRQSARRGGRVHLGVGVAEVIESALADGEHRLALLRAVASYDAANQSDLPLGLLDQIRDEVGR